MMSNMDDRMPARFDRLAQYNSERTRGIQHTPAWIEEMRALQADFDDWLAQRYSTLDEIVASGRGRPDAM